MKIKVKGLVFVGFAAAVFASSAMADPAISGQNARNTVTSKYYVEHNFQKIGNRVTTTPADNAETWSDSTKYPSMPVLKSVKDTMDAIDVTVANNSNGSAYLNVTELPTGTFTVDLDNAPATTAAELTGPLTNDEAGAFTGTNGDKLVTATAVKALINTESTAGTTSLGAGSSNATVPTSRNVVDYAEAKANKARAIITSGTGQNNTSATGGDTAYPTTAAVYDFVTSQVGSAAYQPKLENSQIGLYLGSYSGGASTWQELQGSSTGTSATTGYVTIQADDGVYKVNLDQAQVASSIAANSGSSAKLATEGAVYNYVGTNFQPIAATDNSIKIGYNGDWQNLGGDGTYVTVSSSNGASSVALTNITAAGTGATSDFTTNNTKLARAGDVYDFVMDQLGGTAIPQAPSDCENATDGVWCALVYGQIGVDGNSNPTYGLKWTIMAPDDGVADYNETQS